MHTFLPSKLMVLTMIAFSTYSTIVFNCNTATSSTVELKRGNKVQLCVHFLPYGIKAAFTVEVDKFTGIAVTRGYEALIGSDTDITVQVENSTTMANPTVS